MWSGWGASPHPGPSYNSTLPGTWRPVMSFTLPSSWYSASPFTFHRLKAPPDKFFTASMAVIIEWSWLLYLCIPLRPTTLKLANGASSARITPTFV